MKDMSRRSALLLGGGVLAAGVTAVNGAISPYIPMASAAPTVLAQDYPASPIEKSGWILTASDEFNVSGATLTSKLWGTKYLQHWTNVDTTAKYKIENGMLRLQINPDSQPWDPSHDGQTVISSIQTMDRNYLHKWANYTDIDHSEPTVYRHAQKYGYFELRARTQRGSGHHSAWWMVGTQSDQGNGVWTSTQADTVQNTELDIFEIPGNEVGKIGTHLLVFNDPKVSQTSLWQNVGVDLSANFHVYGLLWEPGSLKIYIDGQLLRDIPQAPDYPMLTLLGLYEKRQGGWSGSFDSTVPYPKSFDIDYFRAYTRIPTLPYTLEAEDADAYGATKAVSTTDASSGRKLGWLGNGSDNYAQLSRVWVPTAGSYQLTFSYFSAENRSLSYQVNGGTTQTLTDLNSGSWAAAGQVSTTATFNAGFNNIRLSNVNGYAPDLDKILVAHA